MQGGLWNQYTDPIEDEIYTRYKNSKLNRDKIPGQKSFKNDTKCIISHYRMSDVPPYEACNLCIDSLGNTPPESWQKLTVDVTSPNQSNI